jgi:hypothetical protein
MDAVRWGQGPVDYEIERQDSADIRHAREVFRPWRPAESRRVAARWRVISRDGAFEVHALNRDGAELHPQSASSVESAVCIVEFAAIARFIECDEQILCIHSALLSRDGHAVAIVGPSTAGKTTLACALWQKGWSFHCDDAIMIQGGLAYPSPRRVSLRSGSRALVGDSLWNRSMATPSFATTPKGCLFHPQEVTDSSSKSDSIELDAIIFLARRGAPVSGPPTRLSNAETALALWPYTNLRSRLPFNEVVDRLVLVAARAPGFDLPRAKLDDMTEQVENLNVSHSAR